MVVNYKDGKIYVIRSPNINKYYIGSTAQPLHKRFHDHKKKYENGNNLTTSVLVFDAGNAYIELLELCSCNSRIELNKREGELLREHKDKLVNKYLTGQTVEEYSIKNRKNAASFYEINKEKINKKAVVYREANKEKTVAYREANKEKINKKAKEYYISNKEKISEKAKEKYRLKKETE